MTDADVLSETRAGRNGAALRRMTLQWAAAGVLTLAVLGAPRAQETVPPANQIHVVRSGEGLLHIARLYGVTAQELLAENHITDWNRITQGQRLVIPSRQRRPASGQTRVPTTSSRMTGKPTRLFLTFANVDVHEVLDQIASYAHTDILLTPGAKGPVSINLRNRTSEEAIRLVTAAAGLSSIKVGGAYVVGPADEVAKAAAAFGGSDIVALRFLTPAEAVSALARMTPRVKAEATKSGVILSGLDEDMDAARNALKQLDIEPARPKSETAITRLQHADPVGAEKVLADAFPDLKVSHEGGTLILTGTPAELDAAQKALLSLDVEPPKAAEVVEAFVYRLKYLNAQLAETSLKKALPGLTVTVAPEANAPPTANFNPLSSIFGNSFGSSNGSSGGTSGSNGGTTSASGGGGTSVSGGAGGVGGTGGATSQTLSRPTRLILIGPKSDMEVARELLAQTDVPQPSVRIEAVVLEINATNEKDLGILWNFDSTGFKFMDPGGTDLRFGASLRGGLGSDLTTNSNPTAFSVKLQALITQNKARILASPNIAVVDNEDASIFIGDLRRFRGATTTFANIGTVQSVEALPVGIALLLRPRVHPDGDVTLKVHPVVSTITGTVDGLPQTSNREADTTVRLQTGEELVIGGLDRTDVTSVEQKVPILGDIPIIGEFFRNRTHTTTRTEIVILIRAYSVLTDPAPARNFRKALEEKKK